LFIKLIMYSNGNWLYAITVCWRAPWILRP